MNRNLFSFRSVILLAPLGWIVSGTMVGALVPRCAVGMQFTEVSLEAGIDHTHIPLEPFLSGDRFNYEFSWMVGGAAAEDFDGDGWMDLFVLRGGVAPSLLYMNQGDGTFGEEGVSRGADLPTVEGSGAGAADFDNDGDIDLCVTTEFGPHYLLINQGGGTFEVDTTQIPDPKFLATSPSWGDIDNDGLLELLIGEWDGQQTYPQSLFLYKNLGGGELQQHPFSANLGLSRLIFSPRFADLNNDRFVDLAITSDFLNSQVFLNNRDGTFTNFTAQSMAASDENGMGSAIGDYDNDGDLDWFVSSIWDASQTTGLGWGVTGNRLYQNTGTGVFEDTTDTAGVRDGNWGWGSAWGDFDNDGDLDLFHVNGWSSDNLPGLGYTKFDNRPARLFENLGTGSFQEGAALAGVDNRGQGRGAIVFDYDNDGDMDLFITNNHVFSLQGEEAVREPAAPALYRNDTEEGQHWLNVTLDGTPPFHRDGIGSRAVVVVDGVTQMREINASTGFMATSPERIAHFGLGASAEVDEVRAEWSNGDDVIVFAPASNQTVSLPSPQARVSNRTPLVNEQVVFSGTGALPLQNPREWVVDGEAHGDPLAYTFLEVGTHGLRFNLYTLDGTTLLRSEIVRVEVQPIPGSQTPTPTPTHESDEDPVPTSTLTPRPTFASERSDVNHDGVVDAKDLLELLGGLKNENR